jgi:hypothetical protein
MPLASSRFAGPALVLALLCAARCVPEAGGTAPGAPQPGVTADPTTPEAPSTSGQAQDLCAYAAGGDGPYCARSLLMGSAENVLHLCARGATSSQSVCPGRCGQGPDGMPGGGDDACEGTTIEQQPTAQPPAESTSPITPVSAGDPCSAATLGDGGYCARSLDPASTSEELYACVGGRTASIIACPGGCQIMPPGVDDECAATASAIPTVPSPPAASADPCSAANLGDGGYCAQSLDPGSSSSKLYTCVGYQTAAVTSCPNGCQKMPDGMNDVCAGDATAPSSPPIVPTSPATCSAQQANACGGDGAFCSSTGQCKSCEEGLFNCNGLGACECKFGCKNGDCLMCQSTTAFSCGGSSYFCFEGQCRICAAGRFNCDGKGGCECSNGCNGSKCK